jgi:RNA polymerase sigma-70 factor, ECF subfamily
MSNDPDADPRSRNPIAGASAGGSTRELAGYWVRSQSIISAYITANVFDRHHAEDILQDVASVVAESFVAFDRKQSFVAWTLGIARNRILKYYRSRAKERAVLSEDALIRLGEALEKHQDDNEDRREALRHCLQQISGRRREVLEMRYRDNVKVIDIAEQFRMSPSAVSVMLHRVRTLLHECIDRQLGKVGA